MGAKTALNVLASVILALTFVVSGTSNSNGAGMRNFVLCNYATRGAVWARFVSYHTDRRSWMSSGHVYIPQGRCANFDHDGNYVYYFATNRRDKVWSGSHQFCAYSGDITYDWFLGECGSYRDAIYVNFLQTYNSQEELRD